MKNGFYALASLDGAPLDQDDLRTLGLARHAPAVCGIAGFSICAVDEPTAVDSISYAQDPEVLSALLGYLDEAADLALTLGLGSTATPAEIASAAIERYGRDAPVHMLGEWAFVRWHSRKRELTLVMSESCRDPLYFSTDGKRLAISAEMLRLCALGWVGRQIDPLGMALQVSRAGLRHIMTSETLWKGVSSFPPATSSTFAAGTQSTLVASPRPEPEPWVRSFDEAVEALNAVGNRIMRQQLVRYGKAAFLLSGGIDSSLLTTWGAQARGPGDEIFCVSSVAPPGSDLPDEREFSSAVAGQLGVEVHFVSPPTEWSAYRPDPSAFAYYQSAVIDARHYLVLALREAARAGGARVLIDGVFGEFSVTDKTPLPVRESWVQQLRHIVGARLRQRRDLGSWPASAFHLRFSKEMLAQIPPEWEPVWRKGPAVGRTLRPEEPMGISPFMQKNAAGGTSTAFGIRHVMPYRDRRLLVLAAAMPKGFAHAAGVTRSLARTMLKGRIPEPVRLRPRGRPFSPDYDSRMQTQAEDARARIDCFRAAHLEEWLDLDWLSSSLHEIAQGKKKMTTAERFRVQGTSITAEFLLWANEGRTPTVDEFTAIYSLTHRP